MELQELQEYIKGIDYKPELSNGYFLKLVEEVGELSEAIRKNNTGQPELSELKGSIADELYDVLYYVCALANVHGVSLENTHELKSSLIKSTTHDECAHNKWFKATPQAARLNQALGSYVP